MEVVFTNRDQALVMVNRAFALGPRFRSVFERELTSIGAVQIYSVPVAVDAQDAAYNMVRQAAHFIRFGANFQDIDGYFNAYIRMYCQGNRMRLAFAQALQRATKAMARQVYMLAGHSQARVTI